MLLPNINLHRLSGMHDNKDTSEISPGDTKVIIEQGEVLAGILCRKSLGNIAGGIIHVITNEYGHATIKQFMNQVQTVINYWMLHHGYTIGIGDTIADEATMIKINKTISSAKNQVQEMIIHLHQDQLEQKPGLTLMESFEQVVNKELHTARDNAGK